MALRITSRKVLKDQRTQHRVKKHLWSLFLEEVLFLEEKGFLLFSCFLPWLKMGDFKICMKKEQMSSASLKAVDISKTECAFYPNIKSCYLQGPTFS